MNRKLTAILLVLVVSVGSLFAQKSLYFGLGGTYMATSFTNQNNYGLPFEMDYKLTWGGSGNVNIGFDFNKNLGLKVELGYAKLGQNYKDNYKDTIYSRDIKMNYLQIPRDVQISDEREGPFFPGNRAAV
jgi:hypothetical protein